MHDGYQLSYLAVILLYFSMLSSVHIIGVITCACYQCHHVCWVSVFTLPGIGYYLAGYWLSPCRLSYLLVIIYASYHMCHYQISPVLVISNHLCRLSVITLQIIIPVGSYVCVLSYVLVISYHICQLSVITYASYQLSHMPVISYHICQLSVITYASYQLSPCRLSYLLVPVISFHLCRFLCVPVITHVAYHVCWLTVIICVGYQLSYVLYMPILYLDIAYLDITYTQHTLSYFPGSL